MWEPIPLPYRELPGLSAKLLRDHWRLYNGYLGRWKSVHAAVRERDGWQDRWEFGRLMAEESFLRNAVRLHELYFENMVPGGSGSPEAVFGGAKEAKTFVEWMRRAADVSTGWVALAFDPLHDGLFVLSMKDHVTGFAAGSWPLLVLDVYEHAYMPQYGLEKEAYLDAFFRNI